MNDEQPVQGRVDRLDSRLRKFDDQGAGWAEEIGNISGRHTKVSGTLAGFSATILVLVIGAIGVGPSSVTQDNEIVIGLFAMAFFGYVGTGILYSIAVERSEMHRAYLFSGASTVYYFSGVVSFAAVFPLVRPIDSTPIEVSLTIMMIGALLGGYLSASIPIYDLLLVRLQVVTLVLPLSIALGTATYVLARALGLSFDDRLVFLLVSAAVVIVLPFNTIVATFFSDRFSASPWFRILSVAYIAGSTATLAYVLLFSWFQ